MVTDQLSVNTIYIYIERERKGRGGGSWQHALKKSMPYGRCLIFYFMWELIMSITNRNPTKTNSLVSSWKSVRYNLNLDFWDDGLNNNQRI